MLSKRFRRYGGACAIASLDPLVKRADEALDAAKRAGGNKVVEQAN